LTRVSVTHEILWAIRITLACWNDKLRWMVQARWKWILSNVLRILTHV
jgi:hypothetical protein